MRIFVVGGTGFSGARAVERLAMEHEITVLHRGKHAPPLPASVQACPCPSIPYAVNSETSSNSWNASVIRVFSLCAWVEERLAKVDSMAVRNDAKVAWYLP